MEDALGEFPWAKIARPVAEALENTQRVEV